MFADLHKMPAQLTANGIPHQRLYCQTRDLKEGMSTSKLVPAGVRNWQRLWASVVRDLVFLALRSDLHARTVAPALPGAMTPLAGISQKYIIVYYSVGGIFWYNIVYYSIFWDILVYDSILQSHLQGENPAKAS